MSERKRVQILKHGAKALRLSCSHCGGKATHRLRVAHGPTTFWCAPCLREVSLTIALYFPTNRPTEAPMPNPTTPPADAVARLTALAGTVVWGTAGNAPDDGAKAWAEKFVTVWRADLSSLIAAYADAARDRERMIEDEARMEWLEQSRMGPMDAADLITEWRWNGKRYAGGLRSAVDAAIEKERAARTGEAK